MNYGDEVNKAIKTTASYTKSQREYIKSIFNMISKYIGVKSKKVKDGKTVGTIMRTTRIRGNLRHLGSGGGRFWGNLWHLPGQSKAF